MSIIKVQHKSHETPRPYTKQEFEEVFQIAYLEQLDFEDWRVEQYIRKKCAWAYKKGRIEPLTLWLGKLHATDIERDENCAVTIRWIDPEIGYGLFSDQPLKKWSYLGEYSGLLRRRNLLFRNVNDYCFQYPREWIGLQAFTIDSQDQGNYTRFINHSDEPNLEALSFFHDGIFRIGFRACADIPAGTELTYDYGKIFWNHRKKLPIRPLIV
ncbi:MAG: SET domain-containing protein-lysine N-methyltransferase [Chlamydiales bacterium]